jgi:hypothetical protein
MKKLLVCLLFGLSLLHGQTTVSGSATIPAINLIGGIVVSGVPPTATGATYTTDTAANFCLLLTSGVNVSHVTSQLIFIANSGSGTVTIAAGTGITIKGTATIAVNSSRLFVLYLGSCASGSQAWTLQSLGSITPL